MAEFAKIFAVFSGVGTTTFLELAGTVRSVPVELLRAPMLNIAFLDHGAANHSLIDELIGTVATGDVKQRLRVLQRVTDLFVAGSRGYSSQQIALFDDVLQRLVTDIEAKARARLANRLCEVHNAPPGLIRTLAFDDEIDVAGPVLAHSEQLSDADLVENASTKSQDHLLAIAQRLKLSEQVTD